MKTMTILLFAVVASAPTLAASNGSEKSAPAEAKVLPKLAPDAALVKKIADLPDNTWLKLPPVKTAGDLSWLKKGTGYHRWGPKPRDYCNKIVWAPDRKRALYCGGGHNTDPGNDVWEYDLPSNTWVCLYAADKIAPRARKNGKEEQRVKWYKENAVKRPDGTVTGKRGGPLRPCHTWWSLTYDVHRKQLLFLESHKGFFSTDRGALAKALGIDFKKPLYRLYGSAGGDSWLFSFDPETRKWGKIITGVPKAYESSAMEYLSGSRTIFWQSRNTYLYNEKANKWNITAKNGSAPSAQLAYDPESRTIVAAGGKRAASRRVMTYSCKDNTWKTMPGEIPAAAYTPASTFCYDTTAKLFVLVAKGASPLLYDLKTNKWTDPKPQGSVPPHKKLAGYYDPARNVTVIYHTKAVWVYRAMKTSESEGKAKFEKKPSK